MTFKPLYHHPRRGKCLPTHNSVNQLTHDLLRVYDEVILRVWVSFPLDFSCIIMIRVRRVFTRQIVINEILVKVILSGA